VETIAAEALLTYISIYPVLKSEHLSLNTELTLYKAPITSIMTYAFPAWEFAAKLQRLHVAFKIP
jgi:hypothetical protein